MKHQEARFWVWYGEAYVRLKVREGRPLRWSRYSTDEEGWSAESEEYTFDPEAAPSGGGLVTLRWRSDGRDCDGRVSRGGELACTYLSLSSHRNPYTGQLMPDWKPVDDYYRDHSAEAAGY